MSKTVVLAEKPSVGKDIARVLNCKKGGNGYLEGDKYIVTWALGHLVTLADPERYGEQYKQWSLDLLPIMPNKLDTVVIKQTSKQYNTVKEQLYRKDVLDIVIATDAGREGELVARWILDKAKVKKPIKRLWISSVTDKAIKDGFNKLKDGKEYENLYESALSRAEADWLVGINATRALTAKYNAQLSCGRVQTPTLLMIATKENEIRNFKPKKYYGITATTENLKLIWQDSKTKDFKTFDKENCDKILLGVKNKTAQITNLTKTLKKSFAPALYNLTELQIDANKKFGFSAKDTLGIMQKLYESHKVLTYPRTDSRYVTTDIIDTIPDRLKAISINPYTKLAFKASKMPISSKSAFVDNSKVSDHHAIIPTEQSVMLNKLNDGERKIYDLVIKRFLAVLFPAFEYEQTTIDVKIGSENFIAKGKVIISNGWKEVYENNFEDEDKNEDIKEQLLPKLNKGDQLKILNISQTTGETKAPAPFNEATLLSAMENPIKYMNTNDKDLLKTIGETGGLGTVATRADIIEKLFNTFVVEKKGKDIFITMKGKQLLELAPADLKEPKLTAQWEQKLTQISKGQLKKEKFMAEIREYTVKTINEIKNSNEKFRHDNITRTKCPECGKLMLEVAGKKSKMLVCQDRECGFRKALSTMTNARCPKCHKKLELVGEGDGRMFVCSCGYREKLSVFEERKKRETPAISKKDVQKFINQQDKQQQEPINTKLADALSKLKF